jgi:hypothetical protein
MWPETSFADPILAEATKALSVVLACPAQGGQKLRSSRLCSALAPIFIAKPYEIVLDGSGSPLIRSALAEPTERFNADRLMGLSVERSSKDHV